MYIYIAETWGECIIDCIEVRSSVRASHQGRYGTCDVSWINAVERHGIHAASKKLIAATVHSVQHESRLNLTCYAILIHFT